MEPEIVTPEFKGQIEHVIGIYGWLFFMAFVGVLFKDVIHKAVEGLMIFIGHDLIMTTCSIFLAEPQE